ncbi:phosphatase PAP2 family protein [Nocardioides nitrophenolicus]|uniref:phosphatase PAP2 family protein n=1 Tax=Nocardioides nitrophenolicus TaxID=60489 RepID=UPI00195AB427|nr:phosphatase PAP2 family protein [Nocardioides nitrophenolicus]MBM7516130.1 hypothetical protein [Nocardioides nitrophenolicus]
MAATATVTTSPAPARARLTGWRALLVEMGVLIALFAAYNLIRAGWGDDPVAAIARARAIAGLEGGLFDAVELRLNGWLLGVPALAVAACYFYALMHYAMTPAVLLMSRRRGGRQYWRGYWALVAASAIALVGYALLPTAPPRLMPELGTIDVMAQFADYGWWGSAASAPRGLGDATNQYAAMPSLHFGWSLWCAVQLWGFGRTRWRIVAVAYPGLQVLVVLATANHFVLDVLAGGACVVAGYLVVELVIRAVESRRVSPPAAGSPTPRALPRAP